MPRIDPLQLLTCLKVLLDKNGGILSENEVKRIAGLMTKYSKKLVSKCIYIQILKCTKTDLLGEFMGAGGWTLVNMWLTDGLRAINYPLVTEILELLLLCPVDVERLKSNSSPKLVKQLSKEGPSEVRILATRLVEQWLNIVKASNASASASTSDNSANNQTNTINVKSENNDVEIETKKNNKSENSEMVEVKSHQSKQSEVSSTGRHHVTSPNRKLSTDSSSGVMYKIIVKDGKQILSKIENSSTNSEIDETVDGSNEAAEEDCSVVEQHSESDDESSDRVSNKENEKKSKESDSVDGKDTKDKESSSSSSKEKEKEKSKEKSKSSSSSSSSKDKDHKSSSSSSKSSSKTSSSKSSSSSSSSKSKSHSSSKSSSRDKDRGKDKDRERSDKDKDKHRSSSSKTSSSSSSTSKDKDKHRSDKEKSIKDKEKEREKEKTSQAERDKDTLSKILPPSLDKLGKIPKKPKDPNAPLEPPAKPMPTSITIPSKKASMSIEIRKDSEKAKTVKTYKSQFRSHGLTEEAPPPPSRKSLKKPTPAPPMSIPSGGILGNSSFASSLKRASPPPTSPTSVNTTNNQKDGQPVEKKPKIDLTSLPSNVVEKPGAIKLIAAKPKPASLIESDMFMDALSASAFTKKQSIPKRKRRPSATKDAVSPDSPTANKVEPLKFYQDTLVEKEEEKPSTEELKTETTVKDEKIENDSDKVNKLDEEDDDDIPLKKVKEDIDQKSRNDENDSQEDSIVKDEKSDNETIENEPKSPEEPVKKPPGPGCGPDGPPGVLMLHRRNGPKKKLQWRPQEDLEEIRYFEMDETERVNVTKAFTDMKHMERMNEREGFLLSRKVNVEDLMVEQTAWRPLILVDDAPSHPEGCQSKEKQIQADRERSTLKALYFSHAMIPDNPSEPDMEQYIISEPKLIPLDDITGNPDAVNDFISYGYPDPKGTPPQEQDDLMDNNRGCMPGNIPGNEIPFNPNSQFNPFLPFGGQPIMGNSSNSNGPNNWPGGLPNGPISGVPPPNGMPLMRPRNPANLMNMPPGPMLPGGPMGPIPNGPMGPMLNGPMPNGPFNMPPNMIPFGPNGPPPPPNAMMNGPPQNMMNPFGPNNGPPMNMNPMDNGPPMRNPISNRNNVQSGGNWRTGGPANSSNNNANWRSGGGNINNDRGNSRNVNDRSNWISNSNSNSRGVCKQFLRSGFCRLGNKCIYVHTKTNRI